MKKNSMKFKHKNGALAMLDADNALIEAIFLRNYLIAMMILIGTMQMESSKIRHSIKLVNQSFLINFFINRFTWHKSPGTNDMSPNIAKSLDINNEMMLFEFVKAWMDDKNIKYEDWMKLILVPLPKRVI